MHFVNFRLRSCFWGQRMGRPVSWRGPLHRGKSPGYLAEKTNHECGWHRDRDEGFDCPFPAGKRYGVFRGSTAHQKIFLFLHRWEQINFKTMFRRGAYLAEHTLQAASVEFVPPRGTNYARSRLRKPVEKPPRGFSTVSAALHRRAAARWVRIPSVQRRKDQPLFWLVFSGRGCGIRTPANGVRVRCATVTLILYKRPDCQGNFPQRRCAWWRQQDSNL